VGLRVALRLRLRLALRVRRARGRRRALFLRRRTALALAVIRVVEARSLEVDRDRMEDTLHRGAALGALGERVVTHALHDLERMPVVALVFVDRHRRSEYRSAKC